MDKLRTKRSGGRSADSRLCPLDEKNRFPRRGAQASDAPDLKPASEGSSIGMSKCARADKLKGGHEFAVRYDRLVIAEKFIDAPS